MNACVYPAASSPAPPRGGTLIELKYHASIPVRFIHHHRARQAPDRDRRRAWQRSRGTHGICRAIAEIESGALELARGSVTPCRSPTCWPCAAGRNGDRTSNLQPTASRRGPKAEEDHNVNWRVPLDGAARRCWTCIHSRARASPFVRWWVRQNNSGLLSPRRTPTRERDRVAPAAGRSAPWDGWLDTYAKGVAPTACARPATASGPSARPDAHGVGTTEYMRSRLAAGH